MFGDLNPRGAAPAVVGRTLVYYKGANLALSTNAAIPFNTTESDTGGLWTPSANAMVIKQTGLYFLQVQITNFTSGAASAARIYINGDPYSTGAQIAALYLQTSAFTRLAAGDVVNAAASIGITMQEASKRSRFELVGPFSRGGG